MFESLYLCGCGKRANSATMESDFVSAVAGGWGRVLTGCCGGARIQGSLGSRCGLGSTWKKVGSYCGESAGYLLRSTNEVALNWPDKVPAGFGHPFPLPDHPLLYFTLISFPFLSFTSIPLYLPFLKPPRRSLSPQPPHCNVDRS